MAESIPVIPNFIGLREFVIKQSASRIYALLNISGIGLTAPSWELLNLNYLDVDLCCTLVDLNRDLVLGIGVTFGVGYGLNSPRAPIAPNARVCYWGGWGGSLVVNDVDAGFTMAYVMNRMGEGTVGDDRAHTILRAVYQSLDA